MFCAPVDTYHPFTPGATMLNSIKSVFAACQASISVHQKLLSALKTIYDNGE